MRTGTLVLSIALAAFSASPGLADGDAEAGAKVFNRCKACHVADKPQNRVGPSLMGVVGRPAAAVDGFNYSAPMQQKAAEGLVWTEENLAAYLAGPKALVPGGTMAFAGLKKPEEIANVIAYLKAHPAE